MENKNKDEFYIGYLNNPLPETTSYIRKVAWIMFSGGICIALAFILSQKEFKKGVFELYKESEIIGVLYQNPFPVLHIMRDEKEHEQVLLLGFGKFGAEQMLDRIKARFGDIEQWEVKLTGNRIAYNEKTLFQISPNAINTFEKYKKVDKEREKKELGWASMQGEIVDSKCYFGVMKPGEGKIHRSCGIRCISGGIPPILVTKNVSNKEIYFVLVGINNRPINKLILPKIGQYINIKGEIVQIEDWKILKINPNEDISSTGRISFTYYSQEKMCTTPNILDNGKPWRK